MSSVCIVKPSNYLVDNGIDLALAAEKFSTQSEHENPSKQIAKSCNVSHSKILVSGKVQYATIIFSSSAHKSDPMPTVVYTTAPAPPRPTTPIVPTSPAPTTTAPVVPTAPAPPPKKRGRPKKQKGRGKGCSKKRLCRNAASSKQRKESKQGTLMPTLRASAVLARSRVKKASLPDSLPATKILSESEMRATISGILAMNHRNAPKKDWPQISIDVASSLKTNRRTVMNVIKKLARGADAQRRKSGGGAKPRIKPGSPPRRLMCLSVVSELAWVDDTQRH